MKKATLLIYMCLGLFGRALAQDCPTIGSPDVDFEISPSTTTICPGTPVTFSISGFIFNTTSGSTLVYSWYVNGNYVSGAAGSYTTSSLTNGAQVYCAVSCDAPGCRPVTITSPTLTFTVLQPAFAAPSGSTTVCPGTTTTYYTSGTNYTGYNWSLSPSAAGSVSGSSTSATVTWASGYSGTATLSVNGSNSTCSTNSSTSTNVTVRSLATTPTAISGPSTVCQEGTANYSTSTSNADVLVWSVNGTSVGNGTANSPITMPTGLSGSATVEVYAFGCNTTATTTLPIYITPTVASAAAPSGTLQVCQGSAPTLYTTSPVSNSTGYVWSISPSSAGTVSGSGTSGTVTWNSTFSGTAAVGVQATGCNTPAPTTSNVTVIGYVGTPSAPSGVTTVVNTGGTSTYTTEAANAFGYTWTLSPAGSDGAGMINGSGTSATVTWNPLYSGTATVVATASGCNGPATGPATTVALSLPLVAGTITPGYLTLAPGTDPGPLTVSPASGGSCGLSYGYSWQSSPDGNTWTTVDSGTKYDPGVLSATTYYQVVVACNGQTVNSNPVEINIGTISTDLNYVRTRDIARPGVTDTATASGLTSSSDVHQTTQYLDGLGRPVQTVAKQASPMGYDMVTMQAYDQFGRETTHYLPYTSPSGDGNYKPDAYNEQNTFNSGQFPGETFYYGQVNLEPSPLNRSVSTMAAGNSWVGSNRGVENQYLANTLSDSVHIWNIALTAGSLPTDSGTYAAGTLFENVTVDEQGHQVVAYKDREGQVLLKKVQVASAPGMAHVGWLCTYYVYDNLGSLRFVIPPRAVELINTGSSWSMPQAIANELCFRYEYDERNRMIIKKVPGAGENWMVYDVRDRLVMSQDANLHRSGQWLVTQYDGLNRPVETGLINYSSTQANLQQLVTTETSNGGVVVTLPTDTTVSGANTTGDIRASHSITGDNGFSTADSGTFIGEIVNGTWGSGGSASNSNSIVLSPVPAGVTLQPLTITYYDDYSWVSGSGTALPSTFASSVTGNSNYFITSYNSGPVYAVPVTPLLVTRGQVTGTQTLVLGSSGQYLSTINFYDDRARLIQTQAINFTGGLDTATMQYDFSGKPLRSLLGHAKVTNTAQYHKVLTKTNYDPNFRVTSVYKNIDGASSDQLVDSMQYNELGQLLTKYLGKDPATGVPLDSLVYEYNIRGWVTGINKNYVGGTTQHYFGMELGYDNPTSVAGTSYLTPAYNGNIAGTIWKSAGDQVDRKYDFTYDPVNRLTGASYLDNHSGSGWGRATMDYSVDSLSYDANGNIMTMNQHGYKLGAPTGDIDVLSYRYENSNASNKLTQVTDQANDTASVLGDFHFKGAKQDSDYVYDCNGNLTKDNNKEIDTIYYNYLNLPQQVHMKGKGNIFYTYDAVGNKLIKQTVDSAASMVTTTSYLDGFQYQRRTPLNNSVGGVDTLQFMGHEEGRARWAFQKFLNGDSAYNWQYDFFEKDHLGNTRVLLSQEKDTAQYMATMEAAYRVTENALFYNIDSTSFGANQVPGGFPAETNGPQPNDSVAKVDGAGQKMGPALLLKVMSGDSVSIGVYSYYTSTGAVPSPNSSFNNVVNSLASGLATLSGASEGAIATMTAPSTGPIYNAVSSFLPSVDTNTVSMPKAYLNWMLVDNQFNYVSGNGQSGAIPVGAPDVLKSLAGTIKLNHSGYLYIWVSNETPNWPVFFDNLSVQHFNGPLVEENHYYPFGLTMAGISDKALKSNYTENKYRFIGQLYDDDLDWDAYQMKYRTMDPQLGRFWQVDPLSSKYVYNSTYDYAEDRVITGKDFEGAEFVPGQPAPAQNYAAIGHLVNPKTITTETVQAAAQMQQKADQMNGKVAPLAVIGSLEPQFAIPAAISYITGLPVTPSPQAMAGPFIEGGSQAANGAQNQEESITLYRGVNEDHPGFEQAQQGNAIPLGGNATPLEHNVGGNPNSPYVPWTIDKEVAINYALRPTGSGVVLETTVPIRSTIPSPNLKSVNLIQSPGTVVSENEVFQRAIWGAQVSNVFMNIK